MCAFANLHFRTETCSPCICAILGHGLCRAGSHRMHVHKFCCCFWCPTLVGERACAHVASKRRAGVSWAISDASKDCLRPTAGCRQGMRHVLYPTESTEIAIWLQDLRQNLVAALDRTGTTSRDVWKSYWAAQQRFFKLMCVSFKVTGSLVPVCTRPNPAQLLGKHLYVHVHMPQATTLHYVPGCCICSAPVWQGWFVPFDLLSS